MIKYLSIVFVLSLLWVFGTRSTSAFRSTNTFQPENYKQKLSEYGFFKGDAKALQAVEGVIPYFLNTPLFSDYAYKARFISLPKGQKITLKGDDIPDFPMGTVLIKHFYYPADFNKPTEALHFVETRLLVKEEFGWTPLCYVWDEDQKDASLDIAGQAVPVAWKDIQGKAQKIDYQVPSLLQCRYCHTIDNEIRPLGPSGQQLKTQCNDVWAPETVKGKAQLDLWKSQGLLAGTDPAQIHALPIWNDPKTGDLNARARAWLDVNCAHCHSKEASAGITGLFLNFSEKDPLHIGIGKKPITGVLATDDKPFDIVPGSPEKSILVYRVESTDHRVRMPKISCQVPDVEGISLIKDWIKEMK